MTIKRRVSRLENEIGGQSNLHYLIVFGADDEPREQALARTLKAKGLTLDDIGRVSFFGSKRGPKDRVYREDIPTRDLIGAGCWKSIIQDAAHNISLDPPIGATA